jgi:transcriptional regulator with XRE-family HTH domain
VAIRDGRLDRALASWRRIEASVIEDIRSARLASGVSRGELGRAVGLSESAIARFERGELQDIGIELVCRLAAGVGLDASVRLYSRDDPIRDAGQLRLLERLRLRLAPTVRWRVEVPLFGVDDRRAWDAVADGHGCVDAVEAETRLRDLQAAERRIGLKARDDATISHVMLLVADTRANRQALALGREALRVGYPLDTRAAMASLSAGRCPGANAILVL